MPTYCFQQRFVLKNKSSEWPCFRIHVRRLKIMPIVDEYTRECLVLVAERSIDSQRVMEELLKLFETRGTPAFIRSELCPCMLNIVENEK